MATEVPDDPEVDLGFRNAEPKPSYNSSAEPSDDHLSFRARAGRLPWQFLRKRQSLVRIVLVLALSAAGGLLSMAILSPHVERLQVSKHLTRETYVVPPATIQPLPTSESPIDTRPDFTFRDVLQDPLRNGANPATPSGGSNERVFSLSGQAAVPDAVFPFLAPPILPGAESSSESPPPAATDATHVSSTAKSAIKKRQIANQTHRRRTHRIAQRTRGRASFWSSWWHRFFASTAAGSDPAHSRPHESSITKGKRSLWLAVSWRELESAHHAWPARSNTAVRSTAELTGALRTPGSPAPPRTP